MNSKKDVRLKNIIHKSCETCLFSSNNFFKINYVGKSRKEVYCTLFDDLNLSSNMCPLWRRKNGSRTVHSI